MYTVIKKGLSYAIKSFTGKSTFNITFTHRDRDRNPVEGITLEDWYLIAIDRLKFLNQRHWNAENDIQIRHLEGCLQSQRVVIKSKINEIAENDN